MNNLTYCRSVLLQPQLLQDLSAFCRAAGFDPIALQDVGPDVDLTTPVLQQGIALRQAGAAALSLALLDRAAAAGLSSGWLQDNRARALVLLQRSEEARRIWQELLSSTDSSLQAVASEQLQQLAVEERISGLWSQMQQLAAEQRWSFQHLSPEIQRYAPFESALLEEVISAREKGGASLALALIDQAEQAGFRSPWLRDNQARCLLVQGDVLEACTIWRELEACSELEDVRSAAAGMLHSCRREAQRALVLQQEQLRLDRAEQLHQAGDRSAAVNQLVSGLIDRPDSARLEAALHGLLAQRRSVEDPAWSELSPWLQRSELALEAHEALLIALEQRLADQALA